MFFFSIFDGKIWVQ